MKISKTMREQAIEVSDILACQEFNEIGCMPNTICRGLGYAPAVSALCDVGWTAAESIDHTLSGGETNALAAQLLREGLEPTTADIRSDKRFTETEFFEESA